MTTVDLVSPNSQQKVEHGQKSKQFSLSLSLIFTVCAEDIHGEVGVPLSKACVFLSCAPSQWQCGRRLCGWQCVSYQEGRRDGRKAFMHMDCRELLPMSNACT